MTKQIFNIILSIFLDQEDDGGSLQIVTTANLVVGDILNFQKEDEGEKIFEQFKTKEFLIKKGFLFLILMMKM